jgi:hypothetical protein
MDENLTHEQQYLLRRIELEISDLSRDELKAALLDCWEARFRQRQIFLSTTRSAGYIFRMDEGATLFAPETEEDFAEIFGYVPSDEEAEDYMRGLWENATMELDMDAIVLESED